MFIGKTNQKEQAFTLVEVLIAMVIFSLVMALSVTSYRFSLMNLTKVNKNEKITSLTRIKVINKQIHSMLPIFFHLDNGQQAPFFQGNNSQFSFITESPIQVHSPMAIATLRVVDNQLSYCESEFGTSKLENFKGNKCNESFLYLIGEDIELSYFGWKNNLEESDYFSEYLSQPVKPTPKWSSVFLSQDRKLLPIYIEIKRKDQSPIRFKLPEITSFEQGASNAFEG
ncbi:MAG: type II secretion system protein [Pseudoalteromonas sp.]